MKGMTTQGSEPVLSDDGQGHVACMMMDEEKGMRCRTGPLGLPAFPHGGSYPLSIPHTPSHPPHGPHMRCTSAASLQTPGYTIRATIGAVDGSECIFGAYEEVGHVTDLGSFPEYYWIHTTT